MKKRTAIVVGFLAASAIPALQFVVLSLVLGVRNHSTSLSERVLLAAVSFWVFYPYSILFTGVFVVPIFFLSTRLGLANWWFSLVAGALVGICLTAIFRTANHPTSRTSSDSCPSQQPLHLCFG